METTSIAIIGAGSWGTAVAHIVSKKDTKVTLWARETEVVKDIEKNHTNTQYLPNVSLNANIHASNDLKKAVADAHIIVLACPSFALRDVCKQIQKVLPQKRDFILFLSLTKGIDRETLDVMTDVIQQEIKGISQSQVHALLGPSHAEEVSKELPTAVILSGYDQSHKDELHRLFNTPPCLRVYWSDDIMGIQYCSVVKNVIAIASGISDGMKLGDNARSALITRGLFEMRSILRALSPHFDHTQTIYGLAGLGDILATAMSEHSRNYRLGKLIGEGKSAKEANDTISQTGIVIEGYWACKTLYERIKEKDTIPITASLYNILYKDADPKNEVQNLVCRAIREE